VPQATQPQQLSTSATGKINMHNPLQLQFVEETMKRAGSKKKYFTYCRINFKTIITEEYQLVGCSAAPGPLSLLFNVEQSPHVMSYIVDLTSSDI